MMFSIFTKLCFTDEHYFLSIIIEAYLCHVKVAWFQALYMFLTPERG